MPPSLAPIRNWIFDLDNTLYPASADLFAQIDVKMTAYVADLLGIDLVEARRIQKAYFHGHGTTLAGLMREHKVDPLHYLDFVHDIEMGVLEENLPLAAAIARLPGRKLGSGWVPRSRRSTIFTRWTSRPSLRPRPMPGCAPLSGSIRHNLCSSTIWRATSRRRRRSA